MNRTDLLRTMLGWEVTLVCDIPDTGYRAYIQGTLHEDQGMFELWPKYEPVKPYRFEAEQVHCLKTVPGERPILFV